MDHADKILAIDCGTQSLRALVYDPNGKELAKAAVAFEPYRSPRKGWAEQDPQIYWDALCGACQRLWINHKIPKLSIAGVVVTTQRGSVINLDRNGNPLRPAILWLDQRTTDHLGPVPGIWRWLFKIAGVTKTIDYLRANAESNWIRTHEPKIWENTHKYLLVSGYLNFLLTGRFADSIGSQVGYLPFDYKRHCWLGPRAWQWSGLGLDPGRLSTLEPAASVLGEVQASASSATGIPSGTPVFAGAGDKECEVLGSGVLSPGTACLSFGTASTVSVTSYRYVEPIPFLPPYPSAVPDAYNLEVQIFRGYWMVSWFKQHFGYKERMLALDRDTTPETLLEELIQDIPPGSDGLILQPFWSPGLREPGPEARGAVIGFTDRHGKGHFYRAILEGLAYALREGLERIERRTRARINELKVSGGGAQCDTAIQLTADIFGLPATRPHTHETSGLGAAMIAAVGMGFHADFETAVREMTRPGRTFDPDPGNTAHYEQIYRGIYLKMYRRLVPLYRNLSQIL